MLLGLYPYHPSPCMFQLTVPPSCCTQISSLQVHQDRLDWSWLAFIITSNNGFLLPCGEFLLVGLLIFEQHTKWCEPSPGKQCYVIYIVKSMEPQPPFSGYGPNWAIICCYANRSINTFLKIKLYKFILNLFYV